jgi:tetratricopeptide (TPR) repeat protein
MHAGRPAESLEWAEKVLAARHVEEDSVARALQLRGNSRCELGDAGGLEDLERSIEYSLVRGLSTTAAHGYINYGNQLWAIKGPRPALENHRTARTFAAERGLGQADWLLAESMWFLYDLGLWDELLEESEVPLVQRRGAHSPIAMIFAAHRALVLAQRGQLSKAEEVRAEFLGSARPIGDLQTLVPVLTLEALVHERRGRADAAVESVLEVDRRTRGRAPLQRARFLAEDVRILLRTSRLTAAVERIGGVEETLARHRNMLLSASAALTEARGDPEEAERIFADAARRWGGFEHVLETGHAHFGRGRCLSKLGRGAEAAQEFAAARELFATLGAAPLVAELEGWDSRLSL